MNQKKKLIPGPDANIYFTERDHQRYPDVNFNKLDFDLEHLYSEYSKNRNYENLDHKLKMHLEKGKSSEALFYIFTHLFYMADTIELENILIQIILDYNLQKDRFVLSLRKLVILFDDRTEDRYKTLLRVLRDLHELTSQTAVIIIIIIYIYI